jgi:hypothetical protein
MGGPDDERRAAHSPPDCIALPGVGRRLCENLGGATNSPDLVHYYNPASIS